MSAAEGVWPDPTAAVERIEQGAVRPSLVVSATGLLAEFNEAGVLGPLDVHAAAAIVRLFDEPDERVALAAALAVRGTRYGHVCIRLEGLRDAIVVDGQDPAAIDALPWPDPDEWSAALAASALTGRGRGDQPLVLAGDRLYLERYFRYEKRVADLIVRRCRRPPGSLSDSAAGMLDRLLAADADGPNRQLEAAVLAATSGFAVVAGGPGTGKTHTVGALLAALAADGPDRFPLVGLCAPTGKAAARLGESLAELAARIDDDSVAELLGTVGPQTIHRLLGWHPGRARFSHDQRNRLPHELVVVDEMSMVSLPMAAKLLEAVRDEAKVVLVGDPFQLESIEAGTVLADVVGPEARPADRPAGTVSGTGAAAVGVAGPRVAPVDGHIVVLDRVRRFDPESDIADFADAVRTGAEDRAVDLLGGDADRLRWVPDRSAASFGALWSALVEQRAALVDAAREPGDPEAALAALGRMAVLCAHRRGPESVRRWGRDIEAALDDRFTGLRWDGEWYPGRPVMVTTNDYQLDLYNGDVGVAVHVGDGLQAVFERSGVRVVPLSHLGDHTTVHAMTIHKSQGSQFEEVVVVLPGESSRLLTRELLYTAVTRARDRVWVFGAEEAVRGAIGRSVQRASGLGERLWGA